MLIIGFCIKNYIIRHVFRSFWALVFEKLQKSIFGVKQDWDLGPEQNLQNFKNYSSKWPVIGTELYTKVGLQYMWWKIKSEILGVYPLVILGGMTHIFMEKYWKLDFS